MKSKNDKNFKDPLYYIINHAFKTFQRHIIFVCLATGLGFDFKAIIKPVRFQVLGGLQKTSLVFPSVHQKQTYENLQFPSFCHLNK